MIAGFVCTAGEMNRISFVCQQFVILAHSSSNKSADWKEGFCMPDHRLEKITEEHLADVLRIYNHYVLNSTATFHAQALTLAEMRDLVFFTKACHQTYVLLVDERLAGYAYVGPHKNRDAYAATGEISVYLQPGFEGRALASWLSHKSRPTHASTIFMSCWRRSAVKTPTVSSCS